MPPDRRSPVPARLDAGPSRPRGAAPAPETAGALEIRGPADGLLDDPLALRARGTGPGATLRWRARLRDDDGRVWRAEAARAEELAGAWAPAKAAPAGPAAALRSLRPVAIEVRVDAADGRGASRTVRRRLLGEGVTVRRWRAPAPAATLYRPAPGAPPAATALLDATAGGAVLDRAVLAAALLASRGVLALVVAPPPRGTAPAQALAAAAALLEAVPGAGAPTPVDPPLPPGVPALAPDPPGAWDALLARLGARPRGRG